MTMRRDEFLRALCGAVPAMLLAPAACAPKPAGRSLAANIVSNTLGVHVPYMRALSELLPAARGYAAPDTQRVSKLETITQAVLTGSAEIGTGDALSTLRAIQAGADLKIIGNCFMNTSLVFVANRDTAPRDEDLLRPGVTVAINSENDFTHVMLVGPMQKRGIDMRRANVISMGGSGARLRALLSNRIDAAPIHVEQANALVEAGRFRIVIEPWREFDHFLSEVWLVSSAWLKDAQNRRAAVDLLKAVVSSFRAANREAESYAQAYRGYGTEISMRTRPDAYVEAVRQQLSSEVKAWPDDMSHSAEIYRQLLPEYVRLGALKSADRLIDAVETSCLAQALSELGGV